MAVTDVPPRSVVRRSARRDGQARGEMVVGAALVALVALFGAYLVLRPGSLYFDRFAVNALGVHKHGLFTEVPLVRNRVAMVVGAVILSAVTVTRDRVRALAVLVGPLVALFSSEAVVKPLVGRTLGSALTYPSGTVVAAAALTTAVVLVTPDGWRWLVAMPAGAYAAWTAVAVVVLQWHLPTDAAGGLAYGAGVVLLVDGGAWLLLGHRTLRSGKPPALAGR